MADGTKFPTELLKSQAQDLLGKLAERAAEKAGESVQGLTERLTDYAENNGGPGLIAAVTGGKAMAEGKSPVSAALKAGWSGVTESVKQAFGGGSRARKGGRGGRATKAMNIIETIDVGVPVRLAYDQWSQFQDFSQFMKKVSTVEKSSDEKSNWKAQVFWSHRSWEATVIEQIPDERIIWRSQGAKGQVDGAVSFHAITPNLTRVLLVLEYYPQGLMERTGNLWRAQGRRARLELKHFRRHVMTRTVLDPESVEGWRGEIRDSEVVRTHEEAMEAEAAEAEEAEERDEEHPEAADEAGDSEEPAAEDDTVDDTAEDETAADETAADDEYDDEDYDDDAEYDDDEYDEEDEEDEEGDYDDEDEDEDTAEDEDHDDELDRQPARSGRR
jgi:uncharacterized membrane protein